MDASSRYADTPVLVTGAQGFIGSWLSRRLLDSGAQVVVPTRNGQAVDPRCREVEVDILDPAEVGALLKACGMRAIFHLAAQSTVSVARREPFDTYETNVRGTYSLLEACRTAGAPLERIVVASSYLTYGVPRDGPPGVEAELRATYPYEVSKACADVISRSYAHTYGLPIAILRMANVYGGGDYNFTRLVPETARSLVHGERPVLRSDGTPERDFLYVEDAVEAYLAVAASLDDEGARGRAWNGGVGQPVAVLEVVQRLIQASGRDIEPVVQGSRSAAGAIDRQTIDTSALRDELGWQPRWDLDSGLAEAYRWYSSELG